MMLKIIEKRISFSSNTNIKDLLQTNIKELFQTDIKDAFDTNTKVLKKSDPQKLKNVIVL